MIIRTLILVFFLVNQILSQDSYKKWIQNQNIPPEIRLIFKSQKIDQEYKISFHLNPFYIRGDFNSDGKIDVAILIEELKSYKKGIAIVNLESLQVKVLGAGKNFGNGGDDFSWMNMWTVRSKQDEKSGLQVESIFVAKAESASAEIKWKEDTYLWYQEGD